MSLTELLSASEENLVISLEDFFRSNYGDSHLISHGLDHHRRVWGYAREILIHTSGQGMESDQGLSDKLLIACYLHDLGMIRDHGPHHGLHSMDICREFLNLNNMPVSENRDLLDAVRNHDDKEYISKDEKNQLLVYLSAADDLDAFGLTGVYRYTEIYIQRGISPPEIGYQIRENASGRFNNFNKTFHSFPELINKHRRRYNVLDDFFRNYNEQVISYNFRTGRQEGYCGVIEIINEIIESRSDPEKFTGGIINTMTDGVIRDFFTQLRLELF